jgi:hypothetical protein
LNKALKLNLGTHFLATNISNTADFDLKVNKLTSIIQKTIDCHIPMKKPSPFSKHWWCDELKELKTEKNRLSYEAYNLSSRTWLIIQPRLNTKLPA